MKRRDFLGLGAGAAGVALSRSAAASAGLPSAPADAPNILWICTDQQRWDTIGALGNPHIRTPHLDRLAGMGTAFTRAYVQSPICTPSRASFLTGRYPSSVHACLNGNARWADAAPLVTRQLADRGYFCGLAGKLHLSSAHGRIEPRPDDGYQAFYWSHHPMNSWPVGHAYVDWLEAQGQEFDALYEKLGYIPEPLHQTTWCADMAIQFLRNRRNSPDRPGTPWLFSVNIFDPHSPFDPPQEILDDYPAADMPGPAFRSSDLDTQRRLEAAGVQFQRKAREPASFDARDIQARYWAMVDVIDRNVGRMLGALEETNQLDNTIVIFTSDHGETLGDHGLLLKGCRFYEGLVRVPLLVAWPGRFAAGQVSDALVELTDLAPTLLDVAGAAPDPALAGRSLVPLLEGRADLHRHRDTVRAEYYQTLEGPPSYATMIRDDRYKLTTYHGVGLGELYDLHNDPDEHENRWDDPAFASIRLDLTERNFDALAFAVDVGPGRIGRY